MSVFFVAEVKITDPVWVPDYAAKVHRLAERHGGRYLSRSGNIRTLEGTPKDCNLVAIIEFPSEASMDAFVDDPHYRPLLEARKRGSISQVYRVDDTDIAGTIANLKAG